MSVSCEMFVGYTVNLKADLNHEDFTFFHKFEEAHEEYDQYHCKGNVMLVLDGMNGLYARLVYVEKHIEDCWIDGKHYHLLQSSSIPDQVYHELNKAYEFMYGKELDKTLIEYALWFHFS